MLNINGNMATEERERIIQEALVTDEGRMALAQSMANPIQTTLLYQSISRKILVPDPLPQGALARYEKDIDCAAYRISKRGQVPDKVIEGDDFLVPTFEIASYPQIRISQVKERMFNIIDRAQTKAKNEISIQEDSEVFRLLNTSVPQSGTDPYFNHVINSVAANQLQIADLNEAFAKIENHRLSVSAIIMSPRRYADVRNFGQKFRINANTAFIRPWNESTDEELADVASVTANIGLLYRITPDYKITTQYRYVGERQREEIDPRDNLESYQVVDVTFSASNVVNTGLTLRGGVKNLFDTDVVYPSPMVSFAGSLRPSYVDDYPRPGREFWLLADFRI